MMLLILYAAGKVLVYSVVCALGLWQFQPTHPQPLRAALALGTFRFLMGLVFAWAIYLISSTAYGSLASVPAPLRGLATYIVVYVPIRWVEWSLMALLITEDSRSIGGFVFGSSLRDRVWRSGGIAASCIADVPLIASLGWILPVGRFFC